MRLVVLGLTLSSSWGNGHATTFRALLKGFAARGHEILFLERDVPWYRDNRDFPSPPGYRLEFYTDLEDLRRRFASEVTQASWCLVGSYVPQGVEVGQWACETAQRCAFYDIDTPVTLAKLARQDYEYLTPELLAKYDLYLSFAGGDVLDRLESLGARKALPLYCSVDTDLYRPRDSSSAGADSRWLMSYLGTYSDDRQPGLERLMMEPARELKAERFCVAGPQYPAEISWPANVERREHLPPAQHRAFYNDSRWTLNITRADMIAAGYSPSVRLFEAAACGSPILSDYWNGLDSFFSVGSEIMVAHSAREAREILLDTPEEKRRALASAALAKVLASHSGSARARELESYLLGPEAVHQLTQAAA